MCPLHVIIIDHQSTKSPLIFIEFNDCNILHMILIASNICNFRKTTKWASEWGKTRNNIQHSISAKWCSDQENKYHVSNIAIAIDTADKSEYNVNQISFQPTKFHFRFVSWRFAHIWIASEFRWVILARWFFSVEYMARLTILLHEI